MGQDPEEKVPDFIAWMLSGAPGHGASCAGRFVLGVWSSRPTDNWADMARAYGLDPGEALRPFDVYEALAVWDRTHREAFVAWARAPWFP